MTLPDAHSPALVFHRKATWENLRLEHDRVRPGEIPEHRHREHLVVIALDGVSEAELRTETGTSRVYKKPASGGVLVLPAGLRHAARFAAESEYLSIYLDPGFLASVASRALTSNHVEIVERSVAADPTIEQIGKALRAELETEGPGGSLYVESLANVLAVHLLRHYTSSDPVRLRFSGGLAGHKLRRATNYIVENSREALKLEQIAGDVGMSPFHFSREFKKATGLAPHQFLIRHRIERAKILLSRTDLPIVEVSLRTGFQNQSHFTRLFRRLTSLTPRAYRETNRR